MSKIYQIKVQLRDFTPSSYRTIYIKSSDSFFSLSECIMDYFWFVGWHLNEFTIKDWFQEIALTHPDDDWGWMYESNPSDKKKLEIYLKHKNDKCLYSYDFWDWWEFDVTLQDILNSKDLNIDQYPYLKKWKWVMCIDDIWWTWWLSEIIKLHKEKKYKKLWELIGHDWETKWFIDTYMDEIINPDFEQFR